MVFLLILFAIFRFSGIHEGLGGELPERIDVRYEILVNLVFRRFIRLPYLLAHMSVNSFQVILFIAYFGICLGQIK